MSGTMCLRQLSLGYLDMAWFGKDNDVESVEEFEWNAVKKTALMDKMPGASISCSLGHIFAGGYSAGYYSYKWAEVLSADAFSMFEEADLENNHNIKVIGKKFKDTILSLGGSFSPLEVFKLFRGREPKTDSLIRHLGLSSVN